ncbi:MAG: hypothetical protein R8K20_05240 [Gallionellaceae bacterium]
MNASQYFLLLGLSIAIPASATGNDSNNDVNHPSASKQAPSRLSKFTSGLRKNAQFEVSSYVTSFLQSAQQNTAGSVESDSVESWSHGNIETSADLSESLIVNLSLDALFSTYKNEHQGAFTALGTNQKQAHYLDVNTLTVAYKGEAFDLTIGKDSVEVGVAEIYSVADVYNHSNLGNIQHPVDIGVWQTRLDYFFEDEASLSLYVLPIHELAPFMPEDSRWRGNSMLGVEGQTYNTDPKNWGFLMIYSGILPGADYFLSAYRGVSPYAVFKNDLLIPTLKAYPMARIYSAGIAKTIDEWKLYGEVLYQNTEQQADQDYVKYMVGTKYRETTFANRLGLDEISPIIEWSKDVVTREQDTTTYHTSSEQFRPNPSNLIAKLGITINAKWKVNYQYIINLTAKDQLNSFGVNYQRTDSLSFRLTGILYEGNTSTHFGRERLNSNLELGVSYKF